MKYLAQILMIIAAGLFLTSCQTQPTGDKLTVQEAWIRAIGSGEDMGHSMEDQSTTAQPTSGLTTGAFMVISNSGEEDDRLLQVQTDLAQSVELHVTEMKNEVMTMRPVEGIDIPAGGAAELIPGGFHVMLINLQKEIKPGEKYPLTLVFERGGALVVEAEVRAP